MDEKMRAVREDRAEEHETERDWAVENPRLEKQLLKPSGCRAYMRRRLAKAFPAIVSGFVEEAKKGSCIHVKLATQLLGPVRKGTTRRPNSVAKLLKELGD
jgi:hypothetical protein